MVQPGRDAIVGGTLECTLHPLSPRPETPLRLPPPAPAPGSHQPGSGPAGPCRGLYDAAFQVVGPAHHFPRSPRSPQPGQPERPGDRRRRRHELLPATGGDRQRLRSDQGGPGSVPGAPVCLPEHYRPRQRPDLGVRGRAGSVRGRPSAAAEKLTFHQVPPSPGGQDPRGGEVGGTQRRGLILRGRIRSEEQESLCQLSLLQTLEPQISEGTTYLKSEHHLLALSIQMYSNVQTQLSFIKYKFI